MQFSRSDLADFAYFLAIAKHRSFRRAALDLGISASALSHALRGLETRLNVRLLNRTNRSVTLTAAGEELHAAINGPFEAIDRAADVLNRFRDSPSGRIRLNVPDDAATYLLCPVIPLLADRYPDIEVDISVNNRMLDVIEHGFDAGIRFGGTVPEDMITQRLSADIRWIVLGSPGYFERFGTPRHPDDLQHHRCIQLRTGADRIYRWEFDRGTESLVLPVPGAITVDSAETGRRLARNGTGLIYAPDHAVARHIESGALQTTLEDWASNGPGYHIYYSSRRQLPSALRILIDLIREVRPLGM